MIKILAIYDDCDLIIRKMLARLSERADRFEVVIAAPAGMEYIAEGRCRAVEMSRIKSKVSVKAISGLRRIIKAERPDVIFSVSSKALATSLMASIGTGCVNVAYRGTQAKVRRTDPTYYLGLLNPRVKHVVCETPDIEVYLRNFFRPDQLSAMAKPFEVSWVEDAMRDPKSNEAASGLKLIYIGVSKGRPHKGMGPMVEAMRLLEGKPVHLTVIGNADEEVMASAPGNITFMGSRSDAVNFLPTHELFMLTSTRDASPRVVREAQACGVPCVVSDIPGARDLIVDGQTGLLIPPADPQAIAGAVEYFLDNPEKLKEMGDAARNHISTNFKMESYVDFFDKLFSKLASK